MAGWNLKEGLCLNQNPSEEELWNAIGHLFDYSHKTTTYKFCFMKCIIDCIPRTTGLEIDYKNLFYRFTEIYWVLVTKYGLSQIYANTKYQKSKVEDIIEQIACDHSINKIEDLSSNLRDDLVKKVTHYCSQNVVGAFYESTYGIIYSFSKKEKQIVLTEKSKSFFKQNSNIIEEQNYLCWAKMLEKINAKETKISEFRNELDH
jgi:hypothetical protein